MVDTPRGSPPMYFPTGFNLATARTCAELVDVAYDQYQQWYDQDYPDVGSFIWEPSKTTFRYSSPLTWTYTFALIEYQEPFGFVALDASNNGYAVFRGTMNAPDANADLDYTLTPYTLAGSYGNVHRGFFGIYSQLSPQVMAGISQIKPSNGFASFVFAGHSLGSGLSTLSVPDVVSNSPLSSSHTPMVHYNLASPRVGDPQFAWSMNQNGVATYRIVNTEDLVPDTPLPSLSSDIYKHVGTPVDFTAQYDSIANNHALDIAYNYALANPGDPEGPLPTATGLQRRLPGLPVEKTGRLFR